jgi:transcriptional regulator with XRE-family HTH domain
VAARGWFKEPEEQRRAFAAGLYAARVAADLSQAELGAKLDMRQTTIAAWEGAVSIPSPEVVFRLEQVLNLSGGTLSQALGYVPAKPTKPTKKHDPVIDAILGSERLEPPAQQALLAMYRALVQS